MQKTAAMTALVPDRTGGVIQVNQAASDERGIEATSGHSFHVLP